MTKQEFMDKLDYGIRSLSYSERRDILNDYEEHFAQGVARGQSEEEIISNLGDPEAIAAEYVGNSQGGREHPPQTPDREQTPQGQKEEKRDSVFMVLTAIALILFNVIVVLPVYLGIWGALLGIGLAALILTAVGFVLMAAAAVHFLLFVAGLGLAALSVLVAILVVLLCKWLVKGTIAYGRMNIKLVKEGSL